MTFTQLFSASRVDLWSVTYVDTRLADKPITVPLLCACAPGNNVVQYVECATKVMGYHVLINLTFKLCLSLRASLFDDF